METNEIQTDPVESVKETRAEKVGTSLLKIYLSRKAELGEKSGIPSGNPSFFVVDVLRVLQPSDFVKAGFRTGDLRFIRAIPAYFAVATPSESGIRSSDSELVGKLARAGVQLRDHRELAVAIFVRDVFQYAETLTAKASGIESTVNGLAGSINGKISTVAPKL